MLLHLLLHQHHYISTSVLNNLFYRLYNGQLLLVQQYIQPNAYSGAYTSYSLVYLLHRHIVSYRMNCEARTKDLLIPACKTHRCIYQPCEAICSVITSKQRSVMIKCLYSMLSLPNGKDIVRTGPITCYQLSISYYSRIYSCIVRIACYAKNSGFLVIQDAMKHYIFSSRCMVRKRC